MTSSPKHKFIDIGINLTDPVFRGLYRGRRKHADDFHLVLQRAKAAGVASQILTGGSLHESQAAYRLSKEHGLYSTAGCHPTRSSEFDSHPGGHDQYLAKLDTFIMESRQEQNSPIIAIGECGLDYDRTHFATPEVQARAFRSQLRLAKKHGLPLFLHSRSAAADLASILREEGFGAHGGAAFGAKGGVVHSYTGTIEELEELLSMGFYIGVNGCSLKTQENLDVVAKIPLERLMLETDGPWCSMTSTQASRRYVEAMPRDLRALCYPPSCKPEAFALNKTVKGRNEPCTIGAVAWVVAQVHGVSLDILAQHAWDNTVALFGLDCLVSTNPSVEEDESID